jgi:predicted TIM-barrel enzyme
VDEDAQVEALQAYYELDSDYLYFGGVAFKYQRKVEDLETAARIARAYMDVVTTSGPATGEAADIEKIRRMRDGLGPSEALAIASGLTVDNVSEYLPYADVLMVATGVSESWDKLDIDKLTEFVKKVRAFDA